MAKQLENVNDDIEDLDKEYQGRGGGLERQREGKRTNRDRETIIKDIKKGRRESVPAARGQGTHSGSTGEAALLFAFQLRSQSSLPSTKLTSVLLYHSSLLSKTFIKKARFLFPSVAFPSKIAF